MQLCWSQFEPITITSQYVDNSVPSNGSLMLSKIVNLIQENSFMNKVFFYFQRQRFSGNKLNYSSPFRNVLSKAKELGVRTIGLCTISVAERNFPRDLGAHIALSKRKTSFNTSKILTFSWFHIFRSNSKISWSKSKWNCHFVFGAAWNWNLWSVSAFVLSTQSTWRVKRFVAIAEKYFRN